MEKYPRSRSYLLLGLALVAAVAIALYIVGRSSSGRGPRAGSSDNSGIFVGTGSLPPRDPVQPVDPCTLINAAEVEKFVGFAVSSGRSEQSDSPLGQRICRFTSQDDPDIAAVEITLVFTEGMEPFLRDQGYDVRLLYDGNRGPDQSAEPMPDIGDHAFWGGSGAETWNGLHVLAWDVYIHVSVESGDRERDFEAARQIAVLIIKRL